MIENRPKILNLINKLNKNKVNKIDYDNLSTKVDDNTSAIDEIANNEVRVELVKQTTEETINQYIEDGTIANLTLEDNSIETIKYKNESVTEEKIDKNLINELRYVYDENGKKYVVKADENGNIVLNRIYEAFPNKEWVSSIKISSYEKLDYSYSHNDIKVTDDYNNEDIIGRQNGFSPYKIFPITTNEGAILKYTASKARGILENNTSGAYTFITQTISDEIKAYASNIGSQWPYLKFQNIYSSETQWKSIQCSANNLPYYNTTGGQSTYSKSVWSDDLNNFKANINNWVYSIAAIVLEENGKINFYYGNELIVTIDAPEDFLKWDWSWLDNIYNSSFMTNFLKINRFIILNDSINEQDLEDYYLSLIPSQKMEDIICQTNICLQPGEQNNLYYQIIPEGLDKKIKIGVSDSSIINFLDGKIIAIDKGKTKITLSGDAIEKNIEILVGEQISNLDDIINERSINNIQIINPINEMEVGDEYVLYAVGLSNNTIPYSVYDSNLLTMESSDSSVISVQFGTLKALKISSANIIISNLQKNISITLNITVKESWLKAIPNRDIYYVSDRQFDIYNNKTNADKTTVGIQNALDFAKGENYKKIVFNTGEYLLNGDYGLINIPSDLIVDFNNSKFYLEFSEKTKNGYSMITMNNCVHSALLNATFYAENYVQTGGSKSNTTLVIKGDSIRCLIDNCHFWHSSGFNVGCNYTRLNLSGFRLSNVEQGNLLEDGTNDDVNIENAYRTIDFIDISDLGNTIGLGNMQGFQGYLYMSARIYHIFFFNEEKTFISSLKNCIQYQEYIKPSNAKYCKIVFFQSTMPTSSDPDFKSIAHLYTLAQPKHTLFKNCSFKYAVMTGISPQGGINTILDNCLFEDNGSADPYAHIDWEDGRNHIQGHVVKNCTFNRINNTFRCGITAPAGRDIVFRNNEVNNGSFSFSSETQNARIYKNIFNNVNISLASKTDCAFCGNISSTNFTTGNVLEGMQIINKDNLILNE